MKKILTILGCVLAGACSTDGSREINKTFIKPSEPIACMLKDRLLSCRSRDKELSHHGWFSLDVTTFYRSSLESKQLAQALGYNGQAEIEVSDDPDALVDPGEFFYTYDATGALPGPEASGIIQLDPTERMWGALIHLKTDINADWYVGAQLPIVGVSRDIGRTINSSVTDDALNASLERYLDGTFEQSSGTSVQEKLKFSKISGKSQRTSGLSDCTLYAGTMLLDNDQAAMTAWAEVLVSSKDRQTGEYLFEPVLGNGGFHALGAGLSGQIILNNTAGRIAGFRFYGKGRIFEEDEQIRTLGLRFNGEELADVTINEDSVAGITELDSYYHRPWGHLILGGQTDNAGFFPLANRLTKEVKVRPGPQLNIGSSFFVQSKSVDVQIGYGLNMQQSEQIKWKTPFFGQDQIIYDAGGMRFHDSHVALSEDDWDIAAFGARDINTINSQPRQVVPELTACQVPHTLLHQLFVQTNFHVFDQNTRFSCSASYQWSENRMVSSAWECTLGLKKELF